MVASRDRIRSNDFTLVAIAMMTPAGSDMNCTIDFGPGWSKGTGEWVGVCLYKLMLFFLETNLIVLSVGSIGVHVEHVMD